MTNNRLIIILIALCLVSYCRTFDVPFIFDDFAYIENNPFIRDFGNYFNRAATLETYAANPGVMEDTLNNFITRPVAYFTFSLDYLFHGKAVTGYHIVNISIHTLNVVFMYLLVMISIRLLCEKFVLNTSDIESLIARKIAFLTAALFAVHPLMTNAVTYITQRMTSLVTLFYLASVFLYACYRSCNNKTYRITIYTFCFISCCAAMLTKEIAFTLPLMLALYEVVFCRGLLRQRIISLAPLLFTMAIIPFNVIGLHNAQTSQAGGALSSINIVNFNNISSWDYLLTQFRAVAFYLQLLLLPQQLSLQHDFSVSRAITDTDVIFSLLLHISLILYGSYLLWSPTSNSRSSIIDKLSGFGIFWFYIALLVESSIIPLNEMAVEYRTYLPSFGFFIFIVCSVQKLSDRFLANIYRLYYILWVPTICILMYMTVMRNEVWRTPDVFWKQNISLYPKLARPYALLADIYINRGTLIDAIQVYRSSILEMPYEPVLYYELGVVYILSKEYELGIHALSQAIIMKPDMKKAYERLAQAYFYLGRHEQAYETFNIASELSNGQQ